MMHYELDSWKLSRKFVREIYRATEELPQHELYGLAAQLRRAAVSVTSHIAEGAGRETAADYRHFLVMARASLSEIDSQLILSNDLDFLADDTTENLRQKARRIRAVLNGQIRSLNTPH